MSPITTLALTAILALGPTIDNQPMPTNQPNPEPVEIGTALTVEATGMGWFNETISELTRLADLTVDSGFAQFGLRCFEDEVVVLVVSDPYQPTSGLVGSFGCVPADNLPVSGGRP